MSLLTKNQVTLRETAAMLRRLQTRLLVPGAAPTLLCSIEMLCAIDEMPE